MFTNQKITAPKSRKLSPMQHSQMVCHNNVAKHLRIANATTGHEKEVHLEKAKKLQSRYK